MRPSKMKLGTTLVTVVALGVVASACGSSSKSGDKVTTTTAPAPLTITAGDYAFTGLPKTIPAGIVDATFVNKGSVPHEMAWIKVAAGTTPKAAFGKVIQGGAFPAFLEAASGIPNTEPGKTTSTKFNLTPGDYIALCTDTGVVGSTKDGQPHFARGMYKQVTVTGSGGDTAPTAAASITAEDYGFALSGLKAGENTIAFTNTGPTQWHFADISVFPKGTTIAQAEANIPKLLASQGPPPAGVAPPEELAASQIASPGYGNTFTATLEKGRTYVVLCFVSDLKGGPPHAIAHKMYKVFTVS
jgi:hypothetical protein